MDLDIRRFEAPDETRDFENGTFEVIRIGGLTLGRATYAPGWKWSQHVGPIAGTDSCRVEHVGMVVSGRAVIAMDDGPEIEVVPGDLFYFPPAAPASAAPGDLDSTFASGGVKMIGFGDPVVAEDVAIQEDGKIVMAGYAVVGGDDDFAVARLKPGGTRDSTFSGDGRRTTPMGTGHGVGLAVATQPDGRIVVVGYASNATGEAFAIGRFK